MPSIIAGQIGFSCLTILDWLNFFLLLLTAANQKEPFTPIFKVKDEPKDEENTSSALPKPSFVFSHEPETSAPSIPEETLKPQEVPGNVLQQDMSVKAASELLMKLSGNYILLLIFTFILVLALIGERQISTLCHLLLLLLLSHQNSCI